jgi:hypothetical protein
MEFYGKDIAYLFMGEYHLATEKLQPNNPSKPSLDLIKVINLMQTEHSLLDLGILLQNNWDIAFTISTQELCNAITNEQIKDNLKRVLACYGEVEIFKNMTILHLAALLGNKDCLTMPSEHLKLAITANHLLPFHFALNNDIKKILENNAVRVKELVDIFVKDRPGVLDDWIENRAEHTVVISVEILLPFLPNWLKPDVDLSEEQVPDLVPDRPKDAIKHLTNMIGISTITLTPLHLAALFDSRKCIDYLLLEQNSPHLKPYSKETGNGWLPVDFVPEDFPDTRYADIKARLKKGTNIKQSIYLLRELHKYEKSLERWKYIRAIEEQIAEAISLDNYICSINDQDNPTTKQLTEKLEKLIWLSVLDTISDDTQESRMDRIVMRHSEAQQIANELEQLDSLAKSKYLKKCLGVFAAGLIGLVVLGAIAVGIMVACPPAVGAVFVIIAVAGITKASLPMSVAGFLLGFLPGALIRHHTLFSIKSPPERFLEASEKVVMTSKNY